MRPQLLAIYSALIFLGGTFSASAQPFRQDPDLYYTVEQGTTMYSPADTTRPYLHLRFREQVYVIRSGKEWSQVRTLDGANGMVRTSQLSNVWIRISKESQTLSVYKGASLIAQYPTDLGYNFFADKEKRGTTANPDHWRTPEGEFYVVSKNPRSEFYRALVLNYPNFEDAERGRYAGLITEAEYESIKQADKLFEMPPMGTELGGWIEIHGDGTGRRANWTRGCIALRNDQIDRLWDWVDVGTPVLIDT
ncbi:MAG: hypothetical protein BMS9Abin05_1271 [Rhodothermia bacterium]|nr:MAG: hypothetical protein BMS9Abin05_1271 [Rhodothermia bacterium]